MQEAKRVVDGWKTSEQAKSGLAQLKSEAATTIKASREEVKSAARGGEEASKGAKKISSDADYNALPSGAEFIAPDGSHRRKP
jgi:hypothetical protein